MKIKPDSKIPFKRILKEHIIDMIIGALIGIWITAATDVGIVHLIQSWGGLAGIASFIAIVHRVYFNGKE